MVTVNGREELIPIQADWDAQADALTAMLAALKVSAQRALDTELQDADFTLEELEGKDGKGKSKSKKLKKAAAAAVASTSKDDGPSSIGTRNLEILRAAKIAKSSSAKRMALPSLHCVVLLAVEDTHGALMQLRRLYSA